MFKHLFILVAGLVAVLLTAFVGPSFIRARSTSASNGCVNNLRQLDGAKQQWMVENHKTTNDVPAWQDILPYLKQKPVCPQGGTYVLGPPGKLPGVHLAIHTSYRSEL